jgi:F-type H+-transporting ATPase subunit O
MLPTGRTALTLSRASLRGGYGGPVSVRTFAAAASPAPPSKPPVALFGIDGTYASALVSRCHFAPCAASALPLSFDPLTTPLGAPSQYTAAAKSSTLPPTASALSSLGKLLSSDSKLPAILSAPTLSPSDKSKIIAELLKHTGSASQNDTVKNFLQTLAENNRLGVLPGVCEKFEVLMGAARGEVELVVSSAQVSFGAA